MVLTPLQLVEAWRSKKDLVWLDSLLPNASPRPMEQGLSLIAAEPDLILEGGASDWPLLERELERRMKDDRKRAPHAVGSGAAIGLFRYDGSFRFGFYERVYRHLAAAEGSQWLSPPPSVDTVQQSPPPRVEPLHFYYSTTQSEFCKMISKAQEEIAQGNIYQICLAHRLQASYQGDPWPLYLSLRQHSPAPFAAYLQLGEESILSSSPECFLEITGKKIVTRPIKGTRPRGKTVAEDAQQAALLEASLKERAELVMITDLERNDLGRICEYGTVVTSQLLHLERYPQLFHLVSTIEGRLRAEISHVQAVATCFPGGSISGAPKKKALEIIQRLEPVPRGLFTGAIGYFGFDGKSQFNIAIRTLLIRHGVAQFHVGAGITNDSLPEQEWEETLHKAAGILAATREAATSSFS
jgi:aminodeoxychorismate synthase component I